MDQETDSARPNDSRGSDEDVDGIIWNEHVRSSTSQTRWRLLGLIDANKM